MERKTKILLWVSVVLNLVFVFSYFFLKLNSPSDMVGVLKQDVKVYMGKEPQQQFILPKGLIVRDASPRGFAAVGHFEPFRFQIILTSDDGNLVDYITSDNTHGSGGYYHISSN